jgi:AAA ATPase containing von Willebrand factor type A (vWA) domain
MSIENNLVESDDLDAFSTDFFGQTSVTPPAEETKEDTEEDDRDATTPEEGDTQIDEDDDTLAPDDDNDEDSDETEEDQETDEPQPKKKNRFQERINEFTRELRETQRQLEAIKAENEKLKQNTDTVTPKPVTTAPPENLGPTPDDTNEDGTEKYPLGEYDPLFVRDIARFTFQQEMERAKAEEAQASEQRKAQEQLDKLGQEWTGKLASAQERYPDLTEKGEVLVSTFEGIDQAYGEYLSSTIMGMEYGPDVLYYLANNVDEAQRIVGLGATGATIALGRIESKFADADAEKQRAKPRVSKAPTPPPANRGSAVAMPDIPADTDKLDDFEAVFFKKKSRGS